MEQYIQDWLNEHPEARGILRAVWADGCAAGLREARTCIFEKETVWAENPFAQPQEVKAA